MAAAALGSGSRPPPPSERGAEQAPSAERRAPIAAQPPPSCRPKASFQRESTQEHIPEDTDGGGADHWTSYIFGVWNLIIRPPRSIYSRQDLLADFPNELFRFGERVARRRHFHVKNERGLNLACTLFEPLLPKTPPARRASEDRSLSSSSTESSSDESPDCEQETERACVVYCHGNGSCRLAGFHLALPLLPLGISLLCFDFAGSGMSEGDYVSLGYYERDDIAAVVAHLRSQGYSHIGLWGYSMGAASTLMHAARDPTLAGVVADSPFCDLWQLIQEVIYQFVPLPPLFVSPMMHMVRFVISQKAGFDICDVSPKAHVGSSFVPTLFLHGLDDNFVAAQHSEVLRKLYCGETQRITMPGLRHADSRGQAFIARALVFLVRAFRWERFIPQGYGARIFEELMQGQLPARGRAEAGRALAAKESKQRMQRESESINKALLSSDPERVAFGFKESALLLCGPYKGAESLPCNFLNTGSQRRPAASYRSATSPACFSGTFSFPDGRSELAFCWLREAMLPMWQGGAGASSFNGEVEFAVVSPNVAALTCVSLGQRQKDAHVTEGCTPGNLECKAMRQLGLGALSLEVDKQHSFSLRVGGTYVELRINGEVVASTDEAPPGGLGKIHLWGLCWRPRQPASAPPKVELGAADEAPTKDAGRGTRRAGGDSSAGGGGSSAGDETRTEHEAQFAQRIATACFGEPQGTLSHGDRARLRSGVFPLHS